MTTYVYDGTFDGLLSAVFTAYARREEAVTVRREATPDLRLGACLRISTDPGYAARVARRLGPETTRRLYHAFLSGHPQIENLILRYVRALLASTPRRPLDEAMLVIDQLAQQVRRESHRMLAFVRFEAQADGTYAATIAPDFNVLPLIGDHFVDRFPTQRWQIIDTHRRLSLAYDGHTLRLLENEASLEAAAQESGYQSLWQVYFHATNIPERRNLRLHLRHVPRRYWPYLTEKKPRP